MLLMTCSIIIVLVVLSWGFLQDRKLKRYEAEFDRLKKESETLNARLEDRFYLEAIFSNMEEEVALINRYYEITDVNPAVLSATGMSKEEIIGKQCYEVLHNRASICQPPHGPCPFKEIFQTGEGRKVTHIHTDARGMEFPVEINATPIKDEEGRVVQIIEVSRNVRERELLKKHVVRADKLRLIEDFIAGVYHDIIDPLNIISSHLQLMRLKWDLDAARSEKIEEMALQTEKINRKIKNLLDFVQGPMFAPARIDIKEIMRKVLDLVEMEFTLENIDFQKDMPVSPLCISGKGSDLSQVFLNLFASARETLSRREVRERLDGVEEGWIKRLAVSAHASPEKGSVVIEIRDNGAEIPGDLLLKLQDSLYIPERELSALFRRLSTCHRIILDHGGVLEITSSPVKGSTYRICLPAWADEEIEK